MSDQSDRPTKQDRRTAAREHAARLREEQRRRARRNRLLVIAASAVGALVVIAVVVVLVVGLRSASSAAAAGTTLTGPAGPEGVVLEQGTPLAADTTRTSGATADGVQCVSTEQSGTHIHTHLTVYVNGALRPIPSQIGIVQAKQCLYWLHVHYTDGVIHIEAPANTSYTLGQFFAVWHQPLSRTSVAGATGKQTIVVNGKPYTGDPAAIPLKSREDIQISVGKAVPFHPVDWSASEL